MSATRLVTRQTALMAALSLFGVAANAVVIMPHAKLSDHLASDLKALAEPEPLAKTRRQRRALGRQITRSKRSGRFPAKRTVW